MSIQTSRISRVRIIILVWHFYFKFFDIELICAVSIITIRFLRKKRIQNNLTVKSFVNIITGHPV